LDINKITAEIGDRRLIFFPKILGVHVIFTQSSNAQVRGIFLAIRNGPAFKGNTSYYPPIDTPTGGVKHNRCQLKNPWAPTSQPRILRAAVVFFFRCLSELVGLESAASAGKFEVIAGLGGSVFVFFDFPWFWGSETAVESRRNGDGQKTKGFTGLISPLWLWS